MGVQGRSSFLYQTGVCVEQVKQFKTYGEQVELLRQRGMRVDDPKHAETLLAQLNYYRGPDTGTRCAVSPKTTALPEMNSLREHRLTWW